MSNFTEKVQKWLIKHKLGDAAEQISCQIKTVCSRENAPASIPAGKGGGKSPFSLHSQQGHTQGFPLLQELPSVRAGISCWWGLLSLLVLSQPAQHSSSSLGSHNAWKSLRAGIKLQKASAALSEIAPGEKGTAWWVWPPQSCILLHP